MSAGPGGRFDRSLGVAPGWAIHSYLHDELRWVTDWWKTRTFVGGGGHPRRCYGPPAARGKVKDAFGIGKLGGPGDSCGFVRQIGRDVNRRRSLAVIRTLRTTLREPGAT